MVWGYLGAVIRAGLLPGKEIMQFFVRYGYAGIIGACFSLFYLPGAAGS